MGDVEQVIARKGRESAAVKMRFFSEQAPAIAACAAAMARAFERGGRLFAMGNGGSACDASHLAVEFLHPAVEHRAPFPAVALSNDSAMLSAVGNDDDFGLVFERQLAALGREGDLAVGISTSGMASNIVRGLRRARSLGMLTVGMTGRDGGRLVDCCDHPFVVPSFSIHRIQETHVALLHVLWDLIHLARGEEDVL